MPPTGHALRAEVGGGFIFVTPGEFAGQHKKTASQMWYRFCGFMFLSCICQLLWDGPVSKAMMHVWFIRFKVHPGEIAGKCMVKPLFLLKFFSV